MHLFRTAVGASAPSSDLRPAVETPAGLIIFHASSDGTSLSDRAPSESECLNDGGRILCWQDRRFHAELLVRRPV